MNIPERGDDRKGEALSQKKTKRRKELILAQLVHYSLSG